MVANQHNRKRPEARKPNRSKRPKSAAQTRDAKLQERLSEMASRAKEIAGEQKRGLRVHAHLQALKAKVQLGKTTYAPHNNKRSFAVAAVAGIATVAVIASLAAGTSVQNSSDAASLAQESEPAQTENEASEETGTEGSDAQTATAQAPQTFTPEMINGIDAAEEGAQSFSLTANAEAPTLGSQQAEALSEATAAFTKNGYSVGCFLLNLNTGKGIAYNLDERVYGASSFKGPYCTYLCQLFENEAAGNTTNSDGNLETATAARNGAEGSTASTADATTQQDGSPENEPVAENSSSSDEEREPDEESELDSNALRNTGLSYSMASAIREVIQESDNDSYKRLRINYDNEGFTEWLEECGVDPELASDTHYPRYSARESALLWLHIYQYLQTKTPTAENLGRWLCRTNVSFIRSGVSEEEGVSRVLNKAGWNSGSARFTGLCDAGIIECEDGTLYLMSTMSNSPDGAYNEQLTNLVTTLFSCRNVLN